MRRILDSMHHMLEVEDHQLAFILIHEFTVERRARELRSLAVGIDDILDPLLADVRAISQANLSREKKLITMKRECFKEPAQLDPRTRDISSPGIKLGRFFEAFSLHRDQFLLTAQVGLTDCPHISKERIQDVIDTYGETAQFTRSTLYGEFMDQDEGELMVFDFQHVMHTIQNPPHARISRHEYAAFCDFAAGRDENCLAIRSGNKLLELIAWREKDTVAATGRFIIEFRKNNLRKEQIWGDGGGIGHAMCDMLDAAGWPINRFDFGAPAGRSQAFVSRGAEIWVNLAQRIARQEICLINDPTLISQLTTRKFRYDQAGRIKLETKDEMDARGLRSPDRADAVIGAFAHGAQNFATFAKRVDDPFAELEKYYEGFPGDDMGNDRGMERIQRELGGWAGE